MNMFHAALVPTTDKPYMTTAPLPAGVFRNSPTNAVGYDSATIIIINNPLPNRSRPSILSTSAIRAWWLIHMIRIVVKLSTNAK